MFIHKNTKNMDEFNEIMDMNIKHFHQEGFVLCSTHDLLIFYHSRTLRVLTNTFEATISYIQTFSENYLRPIFCNHKTAINLKTNMEEAKGCQIRRRRLGNNPNLALTFETGYQVNEGKVNEETPSPSSYKMSMSRENLNSALQEFRNKQQSFDIQIEECEEEEIIIYSDEEGDAEEAGPSCADRPITPTPIQDFGTNVVYTEGPQACDFLKVNAIEHDCYTDVSDADSEEEH